MQPYNKNAVSSVQHANSLRTKQWRYSSYFYPGEELYDHSSDPNEYVNLADDPGYAVIKEALAEQLAASILPRGDVDGNGEVNSLDVQLLKLYLSGLGNLEYSQKFRADLYPDGRDGVLDALDLTLMETIAVSSDIDLDGVGDTADNCPNIANPSQLNSDMADDGGDACDDDDDNDNWQDFYDNCPLIANTDQIDSNQDGVGNACDLDNDGIRSDSDNCPLTSNPDQADSNNDGKGDACTLPPGCG